MSRHDDAVGMRHMLEHAGEAVSMIQEKTKEDLERNRILQLALTRLVEIVGEAAARVSEETRKKHTGIPWQQIVGMRNRLIHGYDIIDLDLLWDTITDDLPPLIRALSSILGNSGDKT